MARFILGQRGVGNNLQVRQKNEYFKIFFLSKTEYQKIKSFNSLNENKCLINNNKCPEKKGLWYCTNIY